MKTDKYSLKIFVGYTLVGSSLIGWAGNKPNIILIYADDLGYADLGCRKNGGGIKELEQKICHEIKLHFINL